MILLTQLVRSAVVILMVSLYVFSPQAEAGEDVDGDCALREPERLSEQSLDEVRRRWAKERPYLRGKDLDAYMQAFVQTWDSNARRLEIRRQRACERIREFYPGLTKAERALLVREEFRKREEKEPPE